MLTQTAVSLPTEPKTFFMNLSDTAPDRGHAAFVAVLSAFVSFVAGRRILPEQPITLNPMTYEKMDFFGAGRRLCRPGVGPEP